MENTVAQNTGENAVHPLVKSHMFVSKKHINLNDISLFEAVSMSAVFLFAVTYGVIASTTLFA